MQSDVWIINKGYLNKLLGQQKAEKVSDPRKNTTGGGFWKW